MYRFCILGMLIGLLLVPSDVPWLKDIQLAPPLRPPLPRSISPLMMKTDFESPDALKLWEQRREILREAWQAPWYLGPVVLDPKFPRNHHELIALIAPRPFLVLGGKLKVPQMGLDLGLTSKLQCPFISFTAIRRE